MFLELNNYYIDAIHEKYAWRLCDFCTVNAERLKRFFPKTLEQNTTPNLATYFVEKKVKAFQANEEFLFVLKEKEQHTLIGLVFIKEVDWTKKQAELAYCIGYQFEGKGYTTEAVRTLSKWAFEQHNLKRLQILVHQSNLASIQVAKNCGYAWQKTLRAAHTPPGEKPLDMELYECYN